MLLCIVCGKVIANVDASTIRYGGCASCSLSDVKRLMDAMKGEGK
jgi:hypothetical protein